MPFISKVIALWCTKNENGDGADGYDYYAPATCIQGNYHIGHGNFVSFVTVASMEGDDDDDDGGYDYAPAA
ncbi:hypothetical protein VNO77_24356 [Canavalia gladiata]|uniref:Uncharacterized protein n=1 Tax=Canavalia gladiata TaxID=3824 RepID=A0AAN9QCN3_CANGL